MRDIWRLFGTELVLVTIPALLVLVFAATRLRRGPFSAVPNIRVVARALIVVLSLVSGAMLFSPVSRTTAARSLDLHLLHTLRTSFTNHIVFAQMVGNLLLLSWLGFLLPLAFRRLRPWMAVPIALLTSAGIETVQFVIAVGRVSSLSDVLFNTVGAAGGALLAKVVRSRMPADRPRALRGLAECGTVPS